MSDTNSGAALAQHIDRIMRVKSDIKGMQADVSELYKGAKHEGFDTKAMKAVIRRLEKMANDPAKAKEEDEIYETYLQAYEEAQKK